MGKEDIIKIIKGYEHDRYFGASQNALPEHEYEYVANDVIKLFIEQSSEKDADIASLTLFLDKRCSENNELSVIIHAKETEITELKSSLEYAENGHLAIFIQNQQLQSTISYQQERIILLTKELDNLNHLMPTLEHHVDEFHRIKKLCNPESLTKKQD